MLSFHDSGKSGFRNSEHFIKMIRNATEISYKYKVRNTKTQYTDKHGNHS